MGFPLQVNFPVPGDVNTTSALAVFLLPEIVTQGDHVKILNKSETSKPC